MLCLIICRVVVSCHLRKFNTIITMTNNNNKKCQRFWFSFVSWARQKVAKTAACFQRRPSLLVEGVADRFPEWNQTSKAKECHTLKSMGLSTWGWSMIKWHHWQHHEIDIMFSPSFDFWVSLLFALANSRAFGEIQLLRGLRNTLYFSPTKWRNRKKALFCKVKWFRRGVDTFICNLGCRHAVTVSLKSFSIWAPNHLKDQKTHLFALATGEYSCHIIEMSTPTFIHQAFSSSLENPVPLDSFVWLWTLALGFMQIKQHILWMQPLSNKWLSFMSHYHCHKVHSVPVLLRWGDALWDEALVSTPWLSWSREKHSECIKHVAFIDPNGFKHPAIQVLIYSQHFTAAFQIMTYFAIILPRSLPH